MLHFTPLNSSYYSQIKLYFSSNFLVSINSFYSSDSFQCNETGGIEAIFDISIRFKFDIRNSSFESTKSFVMTFMYCKHKLHTGGMERIINTHLSKKPL